MRRRCTRRSSRVSAQTFNFRYPESKPIYGLRAQHAPNPTNGKPVVRRGRKVTGPLSWRSAGPPKGVSDANILDGTRRLIARPRPASRASEAAPPAAGHFRYAIDTAAGNADYTRTPSRQNVVILQSYQVPLMQRLKAANPNVKVLIYKDLSGMVERDQWGGVSTGVATQDAAAHPEWFLLNTSGQRFTFRYYSWIWAADIGNAAYQQKWADNVLAEMGDKGWDGVFMDDTNPSMEYHYDVARVAKYPTDAAYQAATESALAGDRRALPRRGQARRPELRLLEGLPGGHQRLAAARRRRHERELRQGRHARPTATTARRSGTPSCSRSRTPRPRASSTWASRTRPTTTARPPASATRRCCWRARATRASRCTATTPTRTGSRSTTTRSARPRAPRRARRAASTGARSPPGSST